jgi:ABC-type lipoprotein release transport system permease subunit
VNLGTAVLWTRIAFLFLVRSGRATAALSVMIVAAVAALIVLSALSVGVEDAMLRNTVGLFSGHITAEALPASIHRSDLRVPGVETVLKRIYMPGILAGGGIVLPLVLCGIDPVAEGKYTALKKKIDQGRYLRPAHREILISRELANLFSVRVGDRLHFTSRLSPAPFALSVAGIYHTGLNALDHGIAFTARDVMPDTHAVWSAAIFLKAGVATDNILDIYRRRFPAGIHFESWQTRMPDLRQLIDLETASMAIVIILVFGVVAIGIVCSFLVFIVRHMREYGILKAMGVSTAEMSLLIAAKVILMNLMACAAGLLLGVLSVALVVHTGGIDISAWTSHNRYFAVSGVIIPRLTMFSLWAPPATALLFSLMAAAWPAILVARKKAADILRLL